MPSPSAGGDTVSSMRTLKGTQPKVVSAVISIGGVCRISSQAQLVT